MHPTRFFEVTSIAVYGSHSMGSLAKLKVTIQHEHGVEECFTLRAEGAITKTNIKTSVICHPHCI